MALIKLLVTACMFLTVLVLCAAFLSANSQAIGLDFIFIPLIEIRSGLALILFFVVGGLAGLLVSTYQIVKLQTENKRLKKRIRNNSQLVSGFTD